VVHPTAPQPQPAIPRRRRAGFGWFPRWRVFTWVILAFNLLMLIWLISGVNASAQDCSKLVGDQQSNCEAGDVGTAIGAGLLIGLWAFGDVILGVLWLVTRSTKRPCPVCGSGVRKGQTQCLKCGHDFARQAQPSAPTPTGVLAPPQAAPNGAYYSPDGAYVWDGTSWFPRHTGQ
jgi:hypothetical protein